MSNKSVSGSVAEDLFIELFSQTFGDEKAVYLYSQYPFYDIYHNSRYADFVLETGVKRIAFEIDDEASHNPALVSYDKYDDDLLKQNSMIKLGWAVYRWTVRRMQQTPENVKDELLLFVGGSSRFRELDDYLPTQRGKTLNGSQLELHDYQIEALKALTEMRSNKETIALLCLATGTGKTLVAVQDARSLGGRVLFIAHTTTLVTQARANFQQHWPEASTGLFVDGQKEKNAHIVCGSVQSVSLNLDLFQDDEFDYLIVDEAHHACSETYQKILAYFKPQFTLGLTATPERADGVNVLEIFQKSARKLGLQEAVELGALVPVRCIRIKTNIDISQVRYNSVRYNARDLESKLCITERNQLIVDVWKNYVHNKRTIVFCVSVDHAKRIAQMFQNADVVALAVSGSDNSIARANALQRFADGDIKVLCACDLLNEGWDCPQTEVIFAARPTMSKVLYTQQIGRGMRLSPGKEFLTVFDFVDISGQFNTPYSAHRLFKVKEYRPGGLVAGKKGQREAEEDLYRRGEKPEAIIDYPVNVMDMELVDLFNWQEEAAGMLSQFEFVRRVDVQPETIERYIQEKKIDPDLIVPIGATRKLKYFHEDTLKEVAKKFQWRIIDDVNRKAYFMEVITKMEMSYSYKPLLLKAILKYADDKGRVKLDLIVDYFKNFFETRRKSGLVVEKGGIYARGGYTDAEVRQNILRSPFHRFEAMNIMRHTKTLGIIEVDSKIWKSLTNEEKEEISNICDTKLNEYFSKL